MTKNILITNFDILLSTFNIIRNLFFSQGHIYLIYIQTDIIKYMHYLNKSKKERFQHKEK